MLKVGLTGGIGTGKSTVSKIFSDNNLKIIDADKVSREVLNIYPEILESIKSEFGSGFFDEDGSLIRRKLGNYIFGNVHRRKKLEDIIMPFIKKEIFKKLHEYDKIGEKICILDAPTLIEQGFHKSMDINIVVYTDRNTQIKRIKDRDNMSYDEAVHRIDSQMPLDEKINEADIVIDNTGDLNKTKKQVERILHSLNEFRGK